MEKMQKWKSQAELDSPSFDVTLSAFAIYKSWISGLFQSDCGLIFNEKTQERRWVGAGGTRRHTVLAAYGPDCTITVIPNLYSSQKKSENFPPMCEWDQTEDVDSAEQCKKHSSIVLTQHVGVLTRMLATRKCFFHQLELVNLTFTVAVMYITRRVAFVPQQYDNQNLMVPYF